MKTNLILNAVIVSCITFSAFADSENTITITDNDAINILVRNNNQFAIEFYKEVLLDNSEENVFFSPYSISSALGMTYFGAREETASEMAEVFHFNLPIEILGRAFDSVTETLTSNSLSDIETGDPFTLAISNNLWVQDDFNLLFTFKTTASTFFDATVENLNFANDPEGSRDIINNWVAERTMNKILNLIPEGILNAETRLVLTNAVYFNASWQHPFNQNSTAHADFHLTDGSVIKVPMMNQEESFRYAATEEWSAVSLNYSGGNATMLIILPKTNICNFEENFDAVQLQHINESLVLQNLRLSMPKFEFTQSISLNKILLSMGMESAFNNYDADFSGITGQRDLYISSIIHKAFIKVDEEGTEAAAATAVIMALRCLPEPPTILNLDKPFLFLIQDTTTGSIIFMGKVINPML